MHIYDKIIRLFAAAYHSMNENYLDKLSRLIVTELQNLENIEGQPQFLFLIAYFINFHLLEEL